jgi:hypothetical protein
MAFSKVEIVGPGNPAHLRLLRLHDREQFHQALMADMRGRIDDDGVMPSQLSPDDHLLRHRIHDLLTHPLGIIGVNPLLGLLDTNPFATERGHTRLPSQSALSLLLSQTQGATLVNVVANQWQRRPCGPPHQALAHHFRPAPHGLHVAEEPGEPIEQAAQRTDSATASRHCACSLSGVVKLTCFHAMTRHAGRLLHPE